MGIEASALLRPGLLEGRVVAVAGPGALADAASAACASLGATVAECRPEAAEEEAAEAAVRAVLDRHGALDVLVVDASTAPPDEPVAVAAALDGPWTVTRAAATAAMIPGDRGGQLSFLAPPPDAGAHATAMRAALENLARTLSIEWARYGIRPVTVWPGAATPAAEVGAVVAYLASPAGDYFSGCVLDLGGRDPAG